MALRNHTPKHINTTPILDRQGKYSFFAPLIKTVAVPVIVIGSLWWFGQPALRIQYTWNGNNRAPIYSQCNYLTLLDGWRDVRPYPTVNNCPLVTTFPFHLSTLIGK